MALGNKNKCRSTTTSLKRSVSFNVVSEVRAFGRKRVEATNEFSYILKCSPILKRQRSECFDYCFGFEKENVSKLEAMPQEILIQILCGVEHEDLEQLVHVSKGIREATVIAKEWHFAYNTPRKVSALRTKIDFPETNGDLDEIEAPDAPMQHKKRRALPCRKKLDEISVNLSDSLEKEQGEDYLWMEMMISGEVSNDFCK